MNGFYPMLNEVHDKAVKDLPLAECALFEHIWRKLIGWNQFEDEISISQLVKETSACRATVITLLNNLEAKRWIIVTRQESKTRRKFTSKIALPRCPGIESRLGWSKIYTRGDTESIPGGSLESRHTTDTLKDSLKTSPQSPPNNVTTSKGQETENEEGGVAPLDEDEDLDGTIQKVRHIQDLIKQKWRSQIDSGPDTGAVKDALREFGGDYRPLVMAITKAADTLNTATPAAALNLVLTIARKEGGGDGGMSQEHLSGREQEIKRYEEGLEKAKEAEDEAAISQLTYLLEQKKESLARLRG